MTLCVEEAVARFDETYWAEDNASQPVLLIDEATQAITEALHRVRSGSELDGRDLVAAGVALGDLFGGLGQLATLLRASIKEFAETDPGGSGPLKDRLQILRGLTFYAQQAAAEPQLKTATTTPSDGDTTITFLRDRVQYKQSGRRVYPARKPEWC
jgi:hypothetical protein